MRLPDILDELYAVLPEEFVATRNDRAVAARKAGDPSLAEKIRKLQKPSAAAWLVNMLVQHRRQEIDQVLELGAALRRAQEDLDSGQLRRLNRQRRDRVAAVAATGQALATQLGHPITAPALAEVEQTLHAAMADPDAAAVVRSGRLSRGLSSTGWGPVDLSDAAAVPTIESDPTRAKDQPKAKKPQAAARRAGLVEAKRASAVAERNRERVEEERAELQRRIDELGSRKAQVITELATLRDQVEALEQERRGIEDQSRFLSRERDRFEHAANQARRDADLARRRLDKFK